MKQAQVLFISHFLIEMKHETRKVFKKRSMLNGRQTCLLGSVPLTGDTSPLMRLNCQRNNLTCGPDRARPIGTKSSKKIINFLVLFVQKSINQRLFFICRLDLVSLVDDDDDEVCIRTDTESNHFYQLVPRRRPHFKSIVKDL